MVTGVVKEAKDELFASPQRCKAAIGHCADLLHRGWRCVAHALFDVAVAEFFGIELWSVGWQPLPTSIPGH